jgi:hypothetical protein
MEIGAENVAGQPTHDVSAIDKRIVARLLPREQSPLAIDVLLV